MASYGENNFGPHESNVANKIDPRVDSDLDNSRTIGGNKTFSGAQTGAHTGAHTGAPLTGAHTGTHAEGVHGPHGSRVENAMDPRVDSDRDNSRTVGGNAYGSHTQTGAGLGHTGTGAGLTGTGAGLGHTTGSTNAGPHNSNAMNKADPRVDSDRDHRAHPANTGVGHHEAGHHTGPTGGALGASAGAAGLTRNPADVGPAPKTAGPHKSDMLNKVDPRVDSNLDGSKTMFGDKTYSTHTSEFAAHTKDPRDASQVPPSVFQAHVGEPQIMHGDHGHNRARRNSKVIGQQELSGI